MNLSDPIAALEIGTSRTMIAIAEPLGPGRISVVAYGDIPSSGVRKSQITDISQAKILVSGGRGVGTKDGFSKLEALAKELKGEVSSSRAMVDAGVMDQSRQVGQTGKTVRPNLYLACGISGAIQHLAGMEESELIIAINKDKFAPIFSVADLGIVGDLHKIVPMLTERLKSMQK
jgi:electron transfer flavoprotein alpha subunit